MANNIDKKEPVANCDQSKIDVTKCDNHRLGELIAITWSTLKIFA